MEANQKANGLLPRPCCSSGGWEPGGAPSHIDAGVALDILAMALARAWQAYDARVSRLVFGALDAVGLHEAGAAPSPLTRHLPLVASPTPQVTAVAVYLAVVLLGLARLRALGPGEPRFCPRRGAELTCLSRAGGYCLL